MTLAQQVRLINNKAWSLEEKWAKHWDARPWSPLHPDYDSIMADDTEGVVLPLPTPEQFTDQSLADLIAIMNGSK